jgi:hypothetical protein
MRSIVAVVCLGLSVAVVSGQEKSLRVQENDDFVQIDTPLLQAKVRKQGYVSGIAAGSLLDRKTGARDIGFGLHIMDFLLGPGWQDDGYSRDPKVHGNLPHHYIEGPQICTQAKKLVPEIIRGKDFVAVRLQFRFTEPAKGFKAGSLWQQTLVFPTDTRYVLCAEQVTSVNDVDNLLYRIDMPGHIRHNGGDNFAQVYLSYHGTIPASAFAKDFAPDEKFLYQRETGKLPKRFIRAYQLKLDGKPGPWLAGMTLDPAEVTEAWCHQRGYVCLIEELHGKAVKAGETFGAAYIVGYFDDIADMERVYDRHTGSRRIEVNANSFTLK